MGSFLGALNLLLSNLEPALEEQVQADMIQSCLHSVMTLPPESEGEDGDFQEVFMAMWEEGRRQ